jgi:predicted  nucleic acid-binding Zn-ribbon protein
VQILKGSSLNRHTTELIELSKIDKEIDSYQPQIDKAEKKIAKIVKKVEDAQDYLDSINKFIAENNAKIASYEEQLKILNNQLSSNVKKSKDISTEKEMKALSIEEDIAKEKMTFANEEIQRLQEINPKKSKEAQEAQEALDQLATEVAAAAAQTQEEKAEIEKSKVTFFNDREKLIREIDQKVLAFYEKIRIWAGNTAVVKVKKQACYGCYMKISDKVYADIIRGEEITTCPHCGRILYIESVVAEA